MRLQNFFLAESCFSEKSFLRNQAFYKIFFIGNHAFKIIFFIQNHVLQTIFFFKTVPFEIGPKTPILRISWGKLNQNVNFYMPKLFQNLLFKNNFFSK